MIAKAAGSASAAMSRSRSADSAVPSASPGRMGSDQRKVRRVATRAPKAVPGQSASPHAQYNIVFTGQYHISCVVISNVDTLHSYRHKVPISDQANRKRVDLSSPFYVEIICDLLLRQLIQSKYHPNKLPPLSFFYSIIAMEGFTNFIIIIPVSVRSTYVNPTSMQTKSQNRGQPFCTLDGAESHYHSTS